MPEKTYEDDLPLNRAEDKFREFVETMARMTTPFDDMAERKKKYAKEYNLPVVDVDEDDVISDYSGDDAWEEAQAFWAMILDARKLLK
jgi:hypothetical protein